MKPTAEQLAALQAFALRHGRTWKCALDSAWQSGAYAAGDDSATLQRIRNTLGPSWLVRFRLPPTGEAMPRTAHDGMPGDGFGQ